MRKVIKFDSGETAVVYKHTDIRSPLTMKIARDLVMCDSVVNVPETKEMLLVSRGLTKEKQNERH